MLGANASSSAKYPTQKRNVCFWMIATLAYFFLIYLSARESYLHGPGGPEEALLHNSHQPLEKESTNAVSKTVPTINQPPGVGDETGSTTVVNIITAEGKEVSDEQERREKGEKQVVNSQKSQSRELSVEYDSQCTWRNDTLVGTCFGLRCKEGKAADVKDAAECSALCCEMGVKCLTWQFREDVGCCTGPVVRLGLESSRSPHWCEPSPPSAWSGKRKSKQNTTIKNMANEDGNGSSLCKWEKEELRGQCFGLGPPRKPKTKEGCKQACCQDEGCKLWQFREDKGCFYGQKGTCESFEGVSTQPYIGKRKPVNQKNVNSEGWLRK
mmetsp:Transcript_43481/g.72277  ORF Transcript_43481/g.72277 Transcript_43481/m.72277 type:complete len:326 (-) Transcript_43481:229-1206(-)